MANREASIQSAADDFNAGLFISVRAAARAYNLPPSTLRDRMHNRVTNNSKAHEFQQRLSAEQEAFLVEWILDEEARSCPPSHARAREMATKIAQMGGDEIPLGRKWVKHFIQCNPRVASIIGRSIEASRALATSPPQILAFLKLFEATRKRLGVHTADIYNMDETGIALGVCTNARVLGDSSKKKTYIKSPEDREWVSIIETISADGRALRPVVIFKGKNLQTTWFPSSGVPDWLYTVSENGWTSNSIGLEWLQRVFIPSTTPSGPLLSSGTRKHRILLVDGHGSHADIDFMVACREAHIHVLYMPAHTSHVLQPLDLAPFSVLKGKYREQVRSLSALDDAAPVKKERFISYYKEARSQALSERIIRAGWRATGLVPYNPELPLRSSQVRQPIRSTTPPVEDSGPHHTLIQTPRKPQDVYVTQQSLQQSENIGEFTRQLLTKASKAIGQANTDKAALLVENQQLKHQVEALQPQKKRKRVTIDPNQRFAGIDEIIRDITKAAKEQAKASYKSPQDAAEKASAEAAALTLESTYGEFQL